MTPPAPPRYHSGEPIRAGDRITWAGTPGRVVFVLGSPEVPAAWTNTADWLGEEDAEGFMLDVEGIGWVFERQSDADLEFVAREP